MMKFDWTEGALAEGLRLYDAGEFFTAHEAWESVWLKLPEPEKTFLQGLIQVTAAFHHLQCDNRLGTTLLLQAALRAARPLSGILRRYFRCLAMQRHTRAIANARSWSAGIPTGFAPHTTGLADGHIHGKRSIRLDD